MNKLSNINPISCVKDIRQIYRKDLERNIIEVKVQFKDEEPAWIPYETLIAIQSR